ncbi:TPA: hypothetical protein ACIQN7_005909 [Bacillus cereus]|nr:hypothetical protein [Bacillus cereus]
MLIKYTDVFKEISTMHETFPWTKGYKQFWQEVSNGSLDNESKNQFLKDLTYFYTRYLEFSSAILHRNVRYDLLFMLSSDYIQNFHVKLDKIPDTNIDISPGMESICNHMLVMAETDIFSYFTSFYTLHKMIFEKEELQSLLSSDEQLSKLLKHIEKSAYTLSRVKNVINHIESRDIRPILNNNFTLCETIDYWFDEIINNYVKEMVPKNIPEM